MSTSEQFPTTAPPIAYCRICGKPVFSATPQQIAQGLVFCQEHAETAAPPPIPPQGSYAGSPYSAPAVSDAPSPGLAFLLGLIPGVGAVYNGQYAKGLVHAVVTGLLITMISHGGSHLEVLLGLLLPAWFFYMAFEAYHTAKRRQSGQVVDEFSGLFTPRLGSKRTLAGPIILIAIGVLFLLDNLGLIEFNQVARYWPVFLIVLGGYLLYVRTVGGARE